MYKCYVREEIAKRNHSARLIKIHVDSMIDWNGIDLKLRLPILAVAKNHTGEIQPQNRSNKEFQIFNNQKQREFKSWFYTKLCCTQLTIFLACILTYVHSYKYLYLIEYRASAARTPVITKLQTQSRLKSPGEWVEAIDVYSLVDYFWAIQIEKVGHFNSMFFFPRYLSLSLSPSFCKLHPENWAEINSTMFWVFLIILHHYHIEIVVQRFSYCTANNKRRKEENKLF